MNVFFVQIVKEISYICRKEYKSLDRYGFFIVVESTLFRAKV